VAPDPGPQRGSTTTVDEFDRLLSSPVQDGDGDEPPRHGRDRTPRRRIWPWLLAILLVILLAIGGAGWWAYQTYPDQVKSLFGYSNDYTGSGSGSVDIVIKPGDSGTSRRRRPRSSTCSSRTARSRRSSRGPTGSRSR
jgi:hypothetical protein